MNEITNFITYIINIPHITQLVLLVLQIFSFTIKTFLSIFFINKLFKTKNPHKSWRYLLIVLICSAIEDFSWIFSLSRVILPATFNYKITLFIVRIAWALNCLMYQSLSLFMETFVEKDTKLKLHNKISWVISSFFIVAFLFAAIYEFHNIKRSPLEFSIVAYESYYTLLVLMPLSLVYVWVKLTMQSTTPRIIVTQLKTLILTLILPHLCADALQVLPAVFPQMVYSFGALVISNILLTASLLFCLRKALVLRFLNFYNHVRTVENINFAKLFRDTLEDLGSASTINEVQLLT